MKLLDIVNAPWAIQPSQLVEIRGIYATHLRGDKIDLAGVEARLGRPLANEPQPYTVQDGVAVLPIDGVIAKRANMFTQVSGGTSSELVGRDLRAALADPAVHSIILAIDSPGGTVDGTQALADIVRASSKPVVALASGKMASAAYWIGSAASAVYIADKTTMVGSIGVVTAHKDMSVAEAQQGIKTTEISAGKYKRIASQYAPLSEDGRAALQSDVDYLYSLFVQAVAANRNTSVETVLADMADGRDFIGQQAIDAGLVDGVSTLDALIASLNANRQGAGAALQASKTPPPRKGAIPMDRTQFAAEHPELLAAVLAEGASAERARIQSVEAAAMPGFESVIAAMKFDGKSTGGDAALAVIAANRKQVKAAADALAAEAPAAVPQAGADAVPAKPKAAAEDLSLPLEARCKAKWEASADLQAEFNGSFGAYLAFEKATSSGAARVLRRVA